MRAVLTTIIVAAILGSGGVFMWRYYGGFEGEQAAAVAFINVYGDYAEVAERVELLVHLPSVESNTDRAELFVLLESMLTEDMDVTRREELARLAFSNLDSLKKEIDSAQAMQAALYESLQKLDNAARVFRSIELQRRSSEIVAVARKRAELSARITSVQSEINEHAYAIITQVLADEGELTTEHINAINNATTLAEERYDTLRALHEELIADQERLTRLFKEFADAAL